MHPVGVGQCHQMSCAAGDYRRLVDAETVEVMDPLLQRLG